MNNRDDLWREGQDLHYAAQLTSHRARKGSRVTVPALGKRPERILVLPQSCTAEQLLRVPGAGFPSLSGGAAGDLYVHLQVMPGDPS